MSEVKNNISKDKLKIFWRVNLWIKNTEDYVPFLLEMFFWSFVELRFRRKTWHPAECAGLLQEMRGRKIIFPGVSALSPVLMPRCLCFSSWQLEERRVFPGNLNINSEFTPHSPLCVHPGWAGLTGGRPLWRERDGNMIPEMDKQSLTSKFKCNLMSSTKSNIS